MKVRDLLEVQKDEGWITNTICKSRVIALDAKDGKILFDTYKNKSEYVEKFFDGDVSALWSDIKTDVSMGYGNLYKGVVMLYLRHGSWEGQDDA